jgi:hypothetical protein
VSRPDCFTGDTRRFEGSAIDVLVDDAIAGADDASIREDEPRVDCAFAAGDLEEGREAVEADCVRFAVVVEPGKENGSWSCGLCSQRKAIFQIKTKEIKDFIFKPFSVSDKFLHHLKIF